MRIFKNKWFARFARKERIGDELLCQAIERAEKGLIDAELGGGVIKQRIARPGGGRSGGYRTIIAFKQGRMLSLFTGLPRAAAPTLSRMRRTHSAKLPSCYSR
jgi:hypothetical protein